jgi:hypothetical protein
VHDWEEIGAKVGDRWVSWRCKRCGLEEQHTHKPEADKKYFYPSKETGGVYRGCDEIVVWSVMEL